MDNPSSSESDGDPQSSSHRRSSIIALESKITLLRSQMRLICDSANGPPCRAISDSCQLAPSKSLHKKDSDSSSSPSSDSDSSKSMETEGSDSRPKMYLMIAAIKAVTSSQVAQDFRKAYSPPPSSSPEPQGLEDDQIAGHSSSDTHSEYCITPSKVTFAPLSPEPVNGTPDSNQHGTYSSLPTLQ